MLLTSIPLSALSTKPVVLKVWCASDSPGELVKRLLAPPPSLIDSVGLGWRPSNWMSGDAAAAAAAGAGTTL